MSWFFFNLAKAVPLLPLLLLMLMRLQRNKPLNLITLNSNMTILHHLITLNFAVFWGRITSFESLLDCFYKWVPFIYFLELVVHRNVRRVHCKLGTH